MTLKMTLKAKNPLVEEYPLASRDLIYEEGYWWLRTTILGLAGVGRFVIRLSDSILIVETPAIVNCLRTFNDWNLKYYYGDLLRAGYKINLP